MATAGATITTAVAGEPAAPPQMHMASTPVAGAAAAGDLDAGAGGAAPSPGRERMPCDVAMVFERQCQSCHGETLNLGAPMPLVTWSELHAPAVSDPSQMVFEMVAKRIQDSTRPMPPKMNGKLAVADRMLLVSWSDRGAPPLAGDAPECP